MRRLAPLAVAAVAVAGGCSGGAPGAGGPTTTGSSPATGSGEETTTTGAAVGSLDWEQCGADTECATLVVPLDYADPGSRTIEIALIRVPAGDPDHRIGSILVNPGGPGASGVDFVDGFRFDAEISARFDLVGFDPRGIGQSTAIGCGDKVPSFRALDPDPDSAAEQTELEAAAKAVADECGAEDGDLLPFVGTDNVVRDMDLIREALGEQQLTYYGFSYGTLLGARYAETFPERVRAVVLDGVLDPTLDFAAWLAGQTTALERTVNEIFGACDDDPSCPVDGGAAAAWDRIAAEVEESPIPGLGDADLTPATLATGTIYATYDPAAWEFLYEALAAAEEGDGSIMVSLADAYNSFGGFTAYAAVECVDSRPPSGSEEFRAFVASLEAISPRLGAAVANELLPCAFWPAPPVGSPAPVTAAGAPPILVVGNTGDAATPFEQAERVAATLEQGVLLTYEGEGHTSYGSSPCVDDAVARYLIDLETPPEGTVCD